MEKVLGIDSGTTTSAVAISEYGSVRNILNTDGEAKLASVVCFTPQGETLIGNLAASYRDIYPERSASHFKTYMGEKMVFLEVDGNSYSPQQLTSMVLKRLKEAACEDEGEEISKAVVTVPTNFGEKECGALREAAKMADIEVLSLLKEPVAAALYSLEQLKKMGKSNMILEMLDVGGGTTDVSVMRYKAGEGVIEEIVSAGDKYCGGEDVDAFFKAAVKKKFFTGKKLDVNQQQELTTKLILAKHRLSNRENTTFSVSTGEDYEKVVVSVTREDLEKCLTENCAKMSSDKFKEYLGTSWQDHFESYRTQSWAERVTAVLKDVDTELQKAKTVPDLLILVGGSSNMPIVKKIVQKVYPNVEIYMSDEPELAVSKGAAIYANYLVEKKKAPVVHWKRRKTKSNEARNNPQESSASDIIKEINFVSAHSYGIKCLIKDANGKETDKVINILYRGSTLPVEVDDVFATKYEHQKVACLSVYENFSSDRQVNMADGNFIGECKLQINGDLPAHSEINVRLSLDIDGKLRVFGYEKKGKTEINATMEVDSLLSKEEFEREKAQVEKVYEQVV